jgi:hypothetical protein
MGEKRRSEPLQTLGTIFLYYSKTGTAAMKGLGSVLKTPLGRVQIEAGSSSALVIAILVILILVIISFGFRKDKHP